MGLPPTRKFCESKNGMRWLSQPEALFSDYLFDRGIEHKRGERYPADFSAKTGRKWARYDIHFCANNGKWIDVEIWGEPDGGSGATLNSVSAGRYRATKGLKETWNRGRSDFLGISYTDCYAAKRLGEILAPYVGNNIQIPKNFLKLDAAKSLYRDKDELLDECRKLAATMPDGIFPADSWLRARGKYEGRSGPVYNSLSIYVFRWLGGTRKVRERLGQGGASTTKWNETKVRTEWAAFLAKTGLTPSQAKGKNRIAELPPETVNEAGRIYRVAHGLGLLKSLKISHTARRTIWTPECTTERWRAFVAKTGRNPTECMSKAQRKKLPQEIVSEAISVYGAARRLHILPQVRQSQPTV
jgi:hypothetical protein